MLVKILLLACMAVLTTAVDKTLEEKTKGEDTVNAVIDKIQSLNIFKKDYDFLRRIAYVESKFGENDNTYRDRYFGGIWQLDEVTYVGTKDYTLHPSLINKYPSISTLINNANWSNGTIWNDLLKPLYSGLAARLHISTIEEEKNLPIPQTLEAQAKYWNTHYNRRDDMYESNFTNAVKELENKTSSCNGKMDLLVLLDGSGSVGQVAFKQSLNFVNDLFGSYSSENVRKGFIQFASTNLIRFTLNNNLTDQEIQQNVAGTPYLNGGTNTNGGILASVDMYRNTVARPGVPKVLTVFTDGMSNEGGSISIGMTEVQKENITSYAVGIGSSINQTELIQIALGDTDRIFELTDFTALTEFFHNLNRDTCKIPQKPELDETTSDELAQNEIRYYELSITEDGLTVVIVSESGGTEGFYSFSTNRPSSAIYDGVFNGSGFHFIPPAAGESDVSFAIKGLEGSNKYTITFLRGQAGSTEPTTLYPEPTAENTGPTTTTEAPGPSPNPVDRTENQKTKGDDVVKASIDKIKASKIFRNDFDFLERIAYVASKFGNDESTYRPEYNGGIWQVDETVYNSTKDQSLHPSLAHKHDQIFTHFGYKWTNTKWERLLRPAASSLAARLLISTIEEERNISIPQTIAAQAKYWNSYINRRDDLTETDFVEAATELEESRGSCRGKMDHIVLLDGSGSVGSENFARSLNFVNNLLAAYSSAYVRKGFIEFSSNNLVIFSLNNTLTDTEIQQKVLTTGYLAANTNTNGGILESVAMYRNTVGRPGVPKVLSVITDGISNMGGVGNGGGVPDIIQARNENIITYAIGVGEMIDTKELHQIALEDPSHVFELTDFEALVEFVGHFSRETCGLPEKPELNVTVADSLIANERRYYEINISQEGVTVFLDTTTGRVPGHYSYQVKHPSVAVHDGVLTNGTFLAPPSGELVSSVFIGIRGAQPTNRYTIKFQPGRAI